MNKNLPSGEIREIFLRFFEEKDHLRIPAASLVPKNDPTLLFINSGMAPLKPYFVGDDKPPRPDLCNVQPCIRTRDIEDVGDRHHLTFFEMLGSWSIGNYFKDRAVELAFELLTERFGFPPQSLYVSVYAGDPELGLPADDQTARAWERVGIARDHIVYLGADNFWGPAGDAGPCGPCTEVFYDTGDEYGAAYKPGGHFDTKGRYIEIWNAGVFMEFDKRLDGSFVKLPFTSVDTGSGLERMTLVLNGHPTVYETDLLRPLMDAIAAELGEQSGLRERRIIADHMRAASFILAEGVVPGNEGRAYIPRRLLRRSIAIATRAGRTGFDFGRLIDLVVDQLGDSYPILRAERGRIRGVFEREQHDFERVIGRGMDRLESLAATAPFTVSGKDAFSLFATYGLPIDLIREFARERGGAVDDDGFEREFRHHQDVSRAQPKAAAEGGDWSGPAVFEALSDATTEFVGHERMAAEGKILALVRHGERAVAAEAGDAVEVVANVSPFYAEGGGQVGDRGHISGDGCRLRVEDTQIVGGRHVHRCRVEQGSVRAGASVDLVVDDSRRRMIMANHSATHLLHAALRSVLGTHVKQAGSLVESGRLRFDFEHPEKMTVDQIQEVERLVNRFVRENHERKTVITTYKEAVAQGALAFFGESYGDKVRMVRFGPVSTELCGGTHVHATGDIGLLRITSESSVASGVRRIVAVTGPAAVEYTLEQDRVLRDLAAELKAGSSELLARVVALKQKPKAAPAAQAGPKLDAGASAAELPGGDRYLAARLDGDAGLLREEALRLADQIEGVACLAGEEDGKARIVVAVAKPKTKTYNASAILRQLAPLVGGKGGGAPHLAQGGGTDPSGIPKLLEQVPAALTR